MSDRFYVVIRDDDYRLHRHRTKQQAIDEARRLTLAVPGHAFFILPTTLKAGPFPQEIPVETVTEPEEPPSALSENEYGAE